MTWQKQKSQRFKWTWRKRLSSHRWFTTPTRFNKNKWIRNTVYKLYWHICSIFCLLYEGICWAIGRLRGLLFHIKGDLISSSWKENEARRVEISQVKKKINRCYPWTQKEKCKSGHRQIVLLSDEEVEGRRLQWQGAELCQKIHITNSSNQSVMQTKNTVTNINVTVKFCSMIVTKLVLRARKVITRNRWIWEECLKDQIVGNKAKGRISERVFQEIKARQIFRKQTFFNPLIRTRTYYYS